MRRTELIVAALALPSLALPTLTLAQTSTPPQSGRSATATDYRLPALPPSGAALSEEPQVFVKEIRVRGVTALDAQIVRAAVAPFENRTVSSAELQTLRLTLTRLYVDAGYVTSGVLLPDQKVVDGIVSYDAVEGALAAVELLGEHKIREDYVAARIERQLRQPLNIAEVQRTLRYMQEDPNIQRLDARLAPGEKPGTSVLRVTVEEQPRFQLGLGADNHRSSSTGAERANVTIGARNLTGLGEDLRASIALSEGAKEGSVQFSVPIAANNSALRLYYSVSDADIVEARFKELDITSETTTWGAAVTLPWIERLDDKLSFELGVESRDSETRLLGIPFSLSPGAQDGSAKTTVGVAGFNWLERGSSYVVGTRLGWRHGFDALGATTFDSSAPDAKLFNPTGADGRFDLFQLQATYLLRLNSFSWLGQLNDRAQLALRTTAQRSRDPLLSLEKIAIGGVNSVRGVPENLLVRDNGVAATIELQLPVFGYRSEPSPLNLAFVPFIDYGRSWDEADTDPDSEMFDSNEARYLLSAGLGVLWQPLRGLDIQAFWGRDVADNFAGDDPRQFRERDLQDDGWHFSLNYTTRW